MTFKSSYENLDEFYLQPNEIQEEYLPLSTLTFEFRKMKEIHIITPVKDSISLTLETIEAILSSDIKVPYRYTVYNDFSTEESTKILAEKAKKSGFNLINLSEITTNPSPNYLLILQHA